MAKQEAGEVARVRAKGGEITDCRYLSYSRDLTGVASLVPICPLVLGRPNCETKKRQKITDAAMATLPLRREEETTCHLLSAMNSTSARLSCVRKREPTQLAFFFSDCVAAAHLVFDSFQ